MRTRRSMTSDHSHCQVHAVSTGAELESGVQDHLAVFEIPSSPGRRSHREPQTSTGRKVIRVRKAGGCRKSRNRLSCRCNKRPLGNPAHTVQRYLTSCPNLIGTQGFCWTATATMALVIAHPLMTVQEAADALRVSRYSIYQLIWSNTLHSIKVGRSRRIVRASFDAYLANLLERGQ